MNPPHTADEPCPGGCDDVDFVNTRLDEGDVRMGRIEAAQSAMSAEITEVLEILRMGKSFFRAASYFGQAVKWVVGVVSPLIAIYFAFKNGAKT